VAAAPKETYRSTPPPASDNRTIRQHALSTATRAKTVRLLRRRNSIGLVTLPGMCVARLPTVHFARKRPAETPNLFFSSSGPSMGHAQHLQATVS